MHHSLRGKVVQCGFVRGMYLRLRVVSAIGELVPRTFESREENLVIKDARSESSSSTQGIPTPTGNTDSYLVSCEAILGVYE